MNFTKSDILKRGRLLKSETELQYDEQEEKMVEYKKVFNAPPTTSTLTTGCNCVKSNQGQLATNVFLHAACTAAPKCKQLCKFSGFCTGFLLQCTMCTMYILLQNRTTVVRFSCIQNCPVYATGVQSNSFVYSQDFDVLCPKSCI